jgi:hypothetical protein
MIHVINARNRKNGYSFHRGAVIVWTAISMTTILGFAALSVDMGYFKVVQTQLQRGADAAALAGASAFAHSTKFGRNFNKDSLTALAESRAQDYAAKNIADGKDINLNTSDILVGYLAHPENLASGIVTTTYPYNAVQCTIYQNTNTFFANIWGIRRVALSATATAVLNNRIGGYRAKATGGPLIPVTVDQATWTDQITNKNGGDFYKFNYQTGQISKVADNISEINIYPEKQKNGSSPAGAGNFGLLNFENGNNSVNPVGDQIQRGLNSDEIKRTIGSDTFTFTKDVMTQSNTVVGTPITYALDGTPGLKASLQSAFTARVGTVVGFFINDLVSGSGSNCVYTITGIQYGILVAADLNGNNKAVIIQPTVYVGPENIIDPYAPQNETAGKIELVR